MVCPIHQLLLESERPFNSNILYLIWADWPKNLNKVTIVLQMSPKLRLLKVLMICHPHNWKMVYPIDKSLLESQKPFDSEHFDTSFDQIDEKCKRSDYYYAKVLI